MDTISLKQEISLVETDMFSRNYTFYNCYLTKFQNIVFTLVKYLPIVISETVLEINAFYSKIGIQKLKWFSMEKQETSSSLISRL